MHFMNFHVSALKLNVAFSVSFFALEHKSLVITERCGLQKVIKMGFMKSEISPPPPIAPGPVGGGVTQTQSHEVQIIRG